MAAALTACGGGSAKQGAATLPPVTATATASASATATSGGVPASATPATTEGAAAFVRYFFAQLEQAYAERNPALIEAVSTADCKTCTNLEGAVSRLRDRNGTVSDYTFNVTDVEVPGVTPDQDTVQALATLSTSQYVEKDSAGAETKRLAGEDNTLNNLTLKRVAGAWRVDAVTNG